METNKNTTGNALRQALNSRIQRDLPSNFTYRMMERVQLEAIKRRKRLKLVSWISLISASLALLGMAYYVLVIYMKINFAQFIPQLEIAKPSLSVVGFYWYIAVLVLLLLGLDYWLRHYRRKSVDK